MTEQNIEHKKEKESKGYKVELDIFEGPLDLLLYLIKRDEIDIYNIPIELVTKQYLEYLELMRMLDINIAGEFLVMAATLIYIKSKMLLPPEERPQEEEEEEHDPRLDLVRQLLEYKKFKDAAGYLHEKEKLQEQIFTRHTSIDIVKTPEMFLEDVGIFDLIGAFKQALQKVETVGWPDVVEEEFTVRDKVNEIRELLKQNSTFNLTDFFDRMKSRAEVVVTFLALLELMRLKFVRVTQKVLFGEIVVQGTGTGNININPHTNG